MNWENSKLLRVVLTHHLLQLKPFKASEVDIEGQQRQRQHLDPIGPPVAPIVDPASLKAERFQMNEMKFVTMAVRMHMQQQIIEVPASPVLYHYESPRSFFAWR